MYDKSNYFAVLPATVRYDKRLTPRSIILYATITSLAGSDSEAYAADGYLAETLGVSERTVSRLIAELEAFKYISVRYEYVGNTKEIAKRFIRVLELPLLLELPNTQALYAVIPSHILGNPLLSVQAKILFAEITAATPTDGYCSKPASFFAELLHASEPTVRRWIKELQDADAVRIEMEYKGDTREIRRRRIYLTEAAAICEKRADLGAGGSKTPESDNSPKTPDVVKTPVCGRNRGMLTFVTTSGDVPKPPRRLRRKRRKASEILRL